MKNHLVDVLPLNHYYLFTIIYLFTPNPFISGFLAPPSLSTKTSIEYPPVPINCWQFPLTPNLFYMWPPRPSLPPSLPLYQDSH